MSFFVELTNLVLQIGPPLLILAVIGAIICYGFSMLRLWFKI